MERLEAPARESWLRKERRIDTESIVDIVRQAVQAVCDCERPNGAEGVGAPRRSDFLTEPPTTGGSFRWPHAVRVFRIVKWGRELTSSELPGRVTLSPSLAGFASPDFFTQPAEDKTYA